MKPLFSIIIPVRVTTPFLSETLLALKNQTLSRFEIIVVDDQMSGVVSPAVKRNLGAKKAHGKYLAFIDDDSYPASNWLETAHTLFNSQPSISAVCGPQLTPPKDDWRRQATGLIVSSWLGSGGAGLYRNRPLPPRFVDDYPTVNLIVRKTDFDKVGGFDTHHWPGEDTHFCLVLTHTHHKLIYYHPSLIVYHHRRPSPGAYLTQIGRYALHRGHFARIYPITSLRLGYLVPTFFTGYLFFLIILFPSFPSPLLLIPFLLYLLLLAVSFISFLTTSSLAISLLSTFTIFLSHIYYGFLFIVGFFRPSLSFSPHPLNSASSDYKGG